MALRILVVDDASFIRDMVKKHLRDTIPDVEVYEATDGNRALAILRNQVMDLILSDWEMPNMSGEELLRNVRSSALGSDTPFMMISSRGDRNHVIQAAESGVSDYLTKPFTPEELLRKIFKQLKAAGKMPAHKPVRQAATQGMAFASVEVLTGGRNADASPLNSSVSMPGVASGPRAAAKKTAIKARAQLRFANSASPSACVVRELTLQSLSGLMQRIDKLPTVFDQAVVDIEMGDGGELARVNGYVHSIQAGESRPGTNVVKIVIRFVDNDAEKFEVLARYIAQM